MNVYHGTRPEDFWEIRKRFIALRKKARLTQKHLGEIINLRQPSISKIECGHRVPWERTWLRFRALEAKHNRPPIDLPTHWD